MATTRGGGGRGTWGHCESAARFAAGEWRSHRKRRRDRNVAAIVARGRLVYLPIGGDIPVPPAVLFCETLPRQECRGYRCEGTVSLFADRRGTFVSRWRCCFVRRCRDKNVAAIGVGERLLYLPIGGTFLSRRRCCLVRRCRDRNVAAIGVGERLIYLPIGGTFLSRR